MTERIPWPSPGGVVAPADIPSVKRATEAVYLVTKINYRHGRWLRDHEGDTEAAELYQRFRAMSLAEADAALREMRKRLAETPRRHEPSRPTHSTMLSTSSADLLGFNYESEAA